MQPLLVVNSLQEARNRRARFGPVPVLRSTDLSVFNVQERLARGVVAGVPFAADTDGSAATDLLSVRNVVIRRKLDRERRH